MTIGVHVPLDADDIRSGVERVLRDFLDIQERTAAAPELALFTGLLREMLTAGGKRIRPLLCVTGWYVIRAEAPPPVVWRMAASLELFHAFALIHDDIMDRSDTRRGRPTAHRALTTAHAGHTGAESLGINAAILLGDLTLGWSYDLLYATADLAPPQVAAVSAVLNALRTECLVGQYLDLTAAGRREVDVDAAWRTIRYKTAKYTIERPLQLGSILAGADPQQLQALSDYAIPLGEAFQLRDDILGVFGDPTQTGKSVLDDLREGKHTVLVAMAYRNATPSQARYLRIHLGNPDLDSAAAEEIRAILTACGARSAVEQTITARYEQAVGALDATTHLLHRTTWLRQFAANATYRTT
ncbi:polyprenyl synthetase family protein [Nocardia sp. NBC_00881]|uniref:polyprenyl synthetase family protein n=1 Tax=Nocardia sp. NBC_00881 TaxID=2975995 RepID=UPI003865030E|nr:polyprenyl synthetase family protein [Nocardia sp. NBC_00881]